jgi:aminopeptidase N
MNRSLILLIILAASARAEESFSFANTPGKLPKSVVPLKYAIRIEPDIDAAAFSGAETISIEVRQPVRRIVLNALGLEITDAKLKAAREIALAAQLDPAEQTLTFALDDELPAGRYELSLRFAGKLTEKACGLYLAPYQTGGRTRYALATQMEATDARRMFPCWDEPVFRSEFALTAVVAETLRVVSNMPAASEKHRDDGRREVTFAPTPKMASYLIAFVAGEFEELHDEIDGTQLGVFTTPGKREQARYALDATKKILAYYNDYFGLRYPLPKLDQIAIPSTGAGGMENWGCIIYNDSALLYDPAASAQATRERVFAIVAHEIAHQWFGDLVTMAWWDNLWLNEGFASWMGTKATDHFNPDWKIWLRSAGGTERAMRLDARATTHPIQQPVASESQATDAFDEITYQKGEAVLRMLESWLGEVPFRDGIRAYMQAHAYGSTTTADLWQAMEKASGKPVRAFAAGWTEQPGFPVVRVSEVAAGANTALCLEQERFTIHQENPAPLKWQIPVIHGPAGEPQAATLVLLQERTQPGATIEAGTAIKANLGAVGYYRVAYDAPLTKRLSKAAPHLAEADRLNLLNDAWAMVEAGRASAADYLDLAAALADDRSPTVLGQMIGVFRAIDRLEAGTKNRSAFRAWACGFLRPHFARLGWEAAPGESPLETQLRSSLLQILGVFGSEDIVEEARDRFALHADHSAALPGNLRGPVFAIVGRNADAATWDQLHALARQEESFEQKRMLYNALASAHDPALAAKTLALSLTDELIPHDAARLVHSVAHEGEQPDLAWSFCRAHLDALLAKLPAIATNHYVPGIFGAFDDTARADELEAYAQKNLPPAVGPSVAKSADNIRFQAEFKARALPQIDAWWQARARR